MAEEVQSVKLREAEIKACMIKSRALISRMSANKLILTAAHTEIMDKFTNEVCMYFVDTILPAVRQKHIKYAVFVEMACGETAGSPIYATRLDTVPFEFYFWIRFIQERLYTKLGKRAWVFTYDWMRVIRLFFDTPITDHESDGEDTYEGNDEETLKAVIGPSLGVCKHAVLEHTEPCFLFQV